MVPTPGLPVKYLNIQQLTMDIICENRLVWQQPLDKTSFPTALCHKVQPHVESLLASKELRTSHSFSPRQH